jgi:phenylacetate-CoA ligase
LAYKIRDGIFPALRPSVLLTRGEMLLPQVRDLLESTFDAPVSDSYACTEARDVAWQCRATGGYHINADNVVVEIVRDDQPAPVGQIGEVVLTDLNRLAMPIIRYKNGDLARLASERCPCGCKLPLIAEIIGRTGQDCRLPNGKTILWNQLKSLMTHQQIRQFQIVQEASGNFLIRYVPEKHAEITAIDNLLMCRFRNLLGHGIGVQIQKTGALPPASSGKTKLVVSHYEAPNLAAVGTD